MENCIKILEKCLNNGKCTECKYGAKGDPMICCKELIRYVLEYVDYLESEEEENENT